MAYDQDAHRRLDDLAKKYANRLSLVRSAREAGRPILNADGNELSLSDCYEDAMVTAQALYAYLVEHRCPST